MAAFADIVPKIIGKYPITSDQITRQELSVVLRGLAGVLDGGVPGAITEFGCYSGTTSVFITRLLAGQGREFHVYDSFEGLPPKLPQDTNAAGINFKAGELSVSKKQFMQTYARAGLPLPIIHKGWFDRLPPAAVPSDIAFAFLDGDFYGSIISSLRLVWPRLAPGATVCVHDYKRETLPGVERAIHDYFGGRLPLLRAEANVAVLQTAADNS
jgi:O-methyltransferase